MRAGRGVERGLVRGGEGRVATVLLRKCGSFRGVDPTRLHDMQHVWSSPD